MKGWTGPIEIHDHLKAQRPKMFQELKNLGTLTQSVLHRQNKINNSLNALQHQGLQPHEAEEMLRDQIYLPTVEDVPLLLPDGTTVKLKLVWYRKYAAGDAVLEGLEREAREAKGCGLNFGGCRRGNGGRKPSKLHGESSAS